jgi:hypothetical protein
LIWDLYYLGGDTGFIQEFGGIFVIKLFGKWDGSWLEGKVLMEAKEQLREKKRENCDELTS